jgi:hypothetical protein
MRWTIAALLGLVLATGCYRTHYTNFSPANPNLAPQQGEPLRAGRSWQHFFIWGWVPVELPIDARAMCSGAQNVDSIETRETFLEGLVAAFAGYYINIYSPWNGAVYCRTRPAPAPAQAPAPAPSAP